jgi:uncharacterized protein YegL
MSAPWPTPAPSDIAQPPTPADDADGPTYKILPVYAVLDESRSMTPHIDALNAATDRIYETLTDEDAVCDFARLSILAFSDHAEVALPLSNLTTIDGLPDVAAKATTSYRAALTTLAETIDRDVAALKDRRYQVLRPAMFFLTDGYPTDERFNDDWQSAYDQLMASPYHPNILAFGFGEAAQSTLEHLATVQAYIAEDISPSEAITHWAKLLTRSVVAAADSLVTGQPQLPAPDPPAGTRALIDPI